MKNAIKTLLLLALVIFCAASHAQSPEAVAQVKARIYKYLQKGDCDKAHEDYQNLKIAVGEIPDIEKLIANCKKTTSMAVDRSYGEWVDLGLPSGTLWKKNNEKGFYSYNKAIKKFGSRLPTRTQVEELRSKCKWKWSGGGLRIQGPNGNSIYIPAVGIDPCGIYSSLEYVGEKGDFWTSTKNGSKKYYVTIDRSGLYIWDEDDWCPAGGKSVRLVQN